MTPDAVRAAISSLGGQATAAEIAAEVSRTAGVIVSGRAIRFLAVSAGAQMVEGQRPPGLNLVRGGRGDTVAETSPPMSSVIAERAPRVGATGSVVGYWVPGEGR